VHDKLWGSKKRGRGFLEKAGRGKQKIKKVVEGPDQQRDTEVIKTPKRERRTHGGFLRKIGNLGKREKGKGMQKADSYPERIKKNQV